MKKMLLLFALVVGAMATAPATAHAQFFGWTFSSFDCDPGGDGGVVGCSDTEQGQGFSASAQTSAACYGPTVFFCGASVTAIAEVSCPFVYDIQYMRTSMGSGGSIFAYASLGVLYPVEGQHVWRVLAYAHITMAPNGTVTDAGGDFNYDLLSEMGCWGANVEVNPYFWSW
jgi:hypothetical protein